MIFCTQCGSRVPDEHHFCGNCGARTDIVEPVPDARTNRGPSVPVQPQVAAPRHFAQLFGLDPRVAFLTLIIDMMLNAGDLATMGLLLPVSIAAGIILGYVVYKAQINWYGDDKESARIKATILGILTAIPTPIPEVFYVPAGVLGLLHTFQKKASNT